MDRTRVQSATIRSVGHNPKTLTLEIEFQNGNVYQYFSVPQAVHAELIEATSAGNFFNTTIKGQYKYAKLERTIGMIHSN